MSKKSLKLYQGKIQHNRISPTPHKFEYNYFQIWLDVEQANVIDQISKFWSSSKFNLIQYKRQNYQPGKQSLHETICQIIKQKTNLDFKGKIYLLGNLSYWGYCYNPVCFYFCYDAEHRLQYILSEIHNTPWGERFTYLHAVADHVQSKKRKSDTSSRSNDSSGDILIFKFDKHFHVSPFMPMDIDYDWRFKIGNEKIYVNMNLQQNSKSIFNATMNLDAMTLDRKQANKIAFLYPVACLKILTAIYWQALCLWVKRIPFHTHPKKSET